MKYAVVYNSGSESKYVGSLSDYINGETSIDPILMSEDAANALLKELDDYVRNEEYIGKTDEDNEQAHWAYEQHEWGFHIEEIDFIETLQELADYINSDEYNQLVVNRIIDENGWTDLCGENNYDVCAFMCEKVTLDENTGEARVVEDNRHRIRIGKRITYLRNAHRMTQADLAKVSGVTLANISRIEHGLYSPGLDVLEKIAEAFGARVDIV